MKVDGQMHRKVILKVKCKKVGSEAALALTQNQLVNESRQPILHCKVKYCTPQSIFAFDVEKGAVKLASACE